MNGEWISVQQELPKGRCFCLVAKYVSDEKKKHVRMAHFDPERACSGDQLFSGEEVDLSIDIITHWMPLPAPPSDGK